MSNNLFDDLTALRSQEVPVALQSGTRYPNPRFEPGERGSQPYLTAPTLGTKPLTFMIHSISANEVNEADALITAMPPPEFQEQPSPTGRGMVNVRIGYNHEDPAYLMARNKEIPKRDAAICLFGCAGLMESTPGASLQEKVDALNSKVPAAVLEWLAREIGDLAMITAVGENDVSSFLAEGSGSSATPSSNASKKRSPMPKKKPSSKR